MTLLIDMNLSPSWVEFFAAHGVSAIHWSSVGNRAASDAEIMSYAAHHGNVVFTHDLDFGAMLAQTGSTAPSVIQVRAQDVLPDNLGPSVLAAISASRVYLAEGSLITVDTRAHRIRVLPIR